MFFLAIILLIILGIALILFEFLINAFILGFLGLVAVISGIILSYQNYGNTIGHYTVLLTFIFSVSVLILFLKNKTWKKTMLKAKIDGKVNIIKKEKINLGDTGQTVTRLAPIGKVIINNEFFEAKSLNEFIDENTEIEIIEILRNQIIVQIKK